MNRQVRGAGAGGGAPDGRLRPRRKRGDRPHGSWRALLRRAEVDECVAHRPLDLVREGAGQQHRAHGGIGCQLLPALLELGDHLARHGIELVRRIQRDGRHRPIDRIAQSRRAHALDRHITIMEVVPAQVNLAGGAFAQLLEDLVLVDDAADDGVGAGH